MRYLPSKKSHLSFQDSSETTPPQIIFMVISGQGGTSHYTGLVQLCKYELPCASPQVAMTTYQILSPLKSTFWKLFYRRKLYSLILFHI